jgi:hypothetical protein
MAINEDVKYTVTLNDMMSGKLKSIDNEAKGLNVSMKNLVMGGIAGLATFAAGDFIKGSVEAFNESAQASAQLDASLKSTGNAAGLSREALDKQSEALMRMSLFDDDAITKSQGLLATFTNIKDKVYMDAVPAITDLATKMGGDLQGATIQVGKALNDPIKGITALSRVGVSFSEDQKKVIKTLVDTGKTAEAQKMILAELNKEFGGSAKAAAETGAGGLIILQNEFGNVREDIGGMVMQIVNELIPMFYSMLDQFKSFVKWVKESEKGIKSIGVAIGVASGAYLIYNGWQKAIVVWEALKYTWMLKGKLATEGYTTAQWLLNIAMDANPVGAVIAGIALLAAGFYYAYEKSESFRQGILMLKDDALIAYEAIAYGINKIKGDEEAANANMVEMNRLLQERKELIEGTYNANKGMEVTTDGSDGKPKPFSMLLQEKEKKGITKGIPVAGGETATKAPKAPSAQANKAITINVTIGKLIETFKIQTNNMSESTSKIKEMVASTLTDALNDSQIVAGI